MKITEKISMKLEHEKNEKINKTDLSLIIFKNQVN